MDVAVRVVLVGHASTEAVRLARFPADEPLDRVGRRELERREPLRSSGKTAARVVTGPELRCRETAAGLGLADGVADPALRDLDAGSWQGRMMSEVPADDLGRWLDDPDFRGHGGESVVALLARVRGWLDTVDGPTTAVTHPAVIRAAVVATLDAPPAAFWRIDIPPLSVTRLHRRGGRWTLRSTGGDYPKLTP